MKEVLIFKFSYAKRQNNKMTDTTQLLYINNLLFKRKSMKQNHRVNVDLSLIDQININIDQSYHTDIFIGIFLYDL